MDEEMKELKKQHFQVHRTGQVFCGGCDATDEMLCSKISGFRLIHL